MLGANPKNCNLANAYVAARHNVIVTVDSDVRVERDFLATVVAPLADPAVGGVTCLYRAAPIDNFASVLGALAINDWFLPSAMVDVARREMDMCYGAVIAVTRRALETIGGFPAMASAVAQDFVMGQRLTQYGFQVVLADCVVETIVTEPDLATLFRHELRWNRAVRACRPRDHMLSLVMQPLPLTAVLLMLPTPSILSVALLGTHVGLRIALHETVRRHAPIPGPSRAWMVPLRECVCFAVWVASFFTRQVQWGKLTMQVGRDLSMSMPDEPWQ
jgi:ceramide glucosyltransferase